MGIELVKLLLLQHAAALSGRAFKVLTYMASTALDKPNGKGQPARLYFAGDDPLLHVLYGDRGRYTAAQVRELRAVLKELVDKGLIESAIDGKRPRRSRQSYRLNLTLAGMTDGGNIPLNIGGDSPDPSERIGGKPASDRGENPTPRTQQEQSPEDLSQDSIPHASALTTGHAREGAAMDEIYVRPGQPHAFQPDAHGESCTVCELVAGHPRHDARSTA